MKTAMLNKGQIILAPLALFMALILNACITQPSAPVKPPAIEAPHGALVLCEGLWKMDNSSITLVDSSAQNIRNDWFTSQNPGIILGDLANDIVIKGDTALIAVSGSRKIVAIRVSTGKLVGAIELAGDGDPRKICIVNDTLAYVTRLLAHAITSFNPKTLNVINNHIPVGPAPEGIASYKNYVFTANSGYGDYLQNLPKAGTISVVDTRANTEVTVMWAGANVIELVMNEKKGRLYACYKNLASRKDSLGGIVEYDAGTMKETRRWSLNAIALCLSPTGDSLYFTATNGVYMIDLAEQFPEPKLIITNSVKDDIWYSIAIKPDDGSIWIGNAGNYQVSGKLLIYTPFNFNSPEKVFTIGINPNTIRFF